MVLTWTPETDATEVGININEKIHQNLTPPEGLAKVVRNFSPSMGRTNGVAFTETAPLVFPALDKLDDNHSGEAKTVKNKMKGAMVSRASILIVVLRRNSYASFPLNYAPTLELTDI